MSTFYLFIFTTVASTTGFLIAVGIISLYLIVTNRSRLARVFLLTTLGLILTVRVLKDVFQVSRPSNALIEVSGYALPSAHAAGSMFLAVILSYFASTLREPARYGLYTVYGLAALTIGISRYQLGVHTPFQIAVGFAVGAFFAIACILFMRRYV